MAVSSGLVRLVGRLGSPLHRRCCSRVLGVRPGILRPALRVRVRVCVFVAQIERREYQL